MKTAITITHILFPFFIGGIIGGAVTGNNAVCYNCIILTVMDAIVGITLQYYFEKRLSADLMKALSFSEENKIDCESIESDTEQNISKKNLDIDSELEKIIDKLDFENIDEFYDELYEDNGSDMNNELCEKMNEIYLRLKLDGARLVQDLSFDEAGQFLFSVCEKIMYAPSKNMFYGLQVIVADDFGDNPVIVYGSNSIAGIVGQIVFVFLVHIINKEIRLFTVEVSAPFALCEYADGSHINYGQIELENIPASIKKIIDGEN